MHRQGLRIFLVGLALLLVMQAAAACRMNFGTGSETTDSTGPSGTTKSGVTDKTTKPTATSKPSGTTAKTSAPDLNQGKEFSSDYGFSFRYKDLALDSVPDGDDFADLTHLSGDKAIVSIKIPDKLYGDPAAWIKTAYDNNAYTTQVLKHFTLDGYPAVLVEFSWTVMKVPMRAINLIALKDGYFYTLNVSMREANLGDVRSSFDLVVSTFHLSTKKIDLAALEPWKAKLPAGYPLDLVPLFAVDSIDTSGTNAAGSYFMVHYIANGKYQDIIDHFKKVMADAQKPDISVGTEHTEMTGVKGGFNVEIDIKYYPLINDCNVSVWLKK